MEKLMKLATYVEEAAIAADEITRKTVGEDKFYRATVNALATILEIMYEEAFPLVEAFDEAE